MTKTRFMIFAIAGVALLFGVTLFAWDQPNEPRVGLFMPDIRQTVAQGKIIYAEQCASCHGDNLEGEPRWRQPKANGRMPAPPHDETGHTWHHGDQQLFDITKYGLADIANLKDYESDMPVYKDILTDEEIIAVLSFIKAQWDSRIREQHDEINRRHSANGQ